MTRTYFDYSTPRRTLNNRNFALYTAGNTVSLCGMWVQRLAVAWLIWDLTESGVWLGAIAMAEFVPTLLVTPISGVLADRFDRRSLAIVGQALAGVQAAILCILTFTGLITPLWIIVLTLFVSVVVAFNQTARLTLVPMMVPRENLTSALAITSVIFNLARFVGPLLAGLMITYIGVGFAFSFNAVTYIAIILALLALDIPKQDRSAARNGRMREELIAGCRYTISHTPLLTLLTLFLAGSVLARPIGELLPGFADTVFGGGASLLAAMTSSLGAGAIVAGLWLSGKNSVRGLTDLTIWAVLVNAVMVILFAATDILWLSLAALTVSGFVQVTSSTGSQTLVQVSVEEHMRGRVLSLWSVIARGGPALGALGLGVLAEYFGFSTPVMVSAALSLAIALVVLLRRDNLKRSFEAQSDA